MIIIAEKIVIEISEKTIERVSTMYEVKHGETVDELFQRMGIDGENDWHYNYSEVRLKLLKS